MGPGMLTLGRPPAVTTTSRSGSSARAANAGVTSSEKSGDRKGALCNQHHLARATEFVCPGWQWRLVRHDRKNAHTPYRRGQVFAGELETGRQSAAGRRLQTALSNRTMALQAGRCPSSGGSFEVDVDWSQEGCVVCLMSRLVPLSLCIIGRRRHPGERWGSIIAAQVQRHRAQHDDRGPLLFGGRAASAGRRTGSSPPG